MFFSPTFSSPLGIDISDLSFKLVQLNKIGNSINIQAWSKLDLPSGLIKDGEIIDQEEAVKYLKKLINKPKYGKINNEMAVACLPETKTFVKLIEVEKTPNDIADIIEVEMEKHVPISIDSIYYDWQVIKDRGDKLLVLIGAAPKNIVNQYTDLLDEAKLSIEALEIEPVALCRALLKEEMPNHRDKHAKGEKNYAIIDIGATRTSMVVYSKNTILFTVSIPISGEEVTVSIADSLKIERDQAEKAKIICGLDRNAAQGVIYKVLSANIEKLTNKIKESFEFYNNHFSERGPIDNIIICGGGANIKGIEEIISKSVSAPVNRGDALINLSGNKSNALEILSETYNLDIDFSKNSGAGRSKIEKAAKKNNLSITQNTNLSLTTAIGLALRGIFNIY